MNLFVLIPAYNAADTLPAVIERTAAVVPPERIIVVNDGSTDATGSIVSSRGVITVHHQQNKGKGAALQSGFDEALNRNCAAVITMDADLQHQPEDIPRFTALYSALQYDIIIGSRLHNMKGMPIHRMLSNIITTTLVRLRTGASIADSQSGFRFITRRVLERIRLEATGFEAETEFLIKAARCGFSFGSIPIATVYANEQSHMTHFSTTINFIKVLFKQY